MTLKNHEMPLFHSESYWEIWYYISQSIIQQIILIYESKPEILKIRSLHNPFARVEKHYKLTKESAEA